MSRLPIGAHDYLKHLNRVKDALEHGELTPAQQNLAEQLLDQVALTRQRRLYIADMVAAGYTDAEIKLAFASPDSPMTILISAFTQTETVKKFQAEINEARKEYADGGEVTRIKAHIRQRNFLLETILGSVDNVGAAHHKALLELADAISRGIAELEGLQHSRAGRVRTKRGAAEAADPAEEPAGDLEEIEPDWGKEFVPDETED